MVLRIQYCVSACNHWFDNVTLLDIKLMQQNYFILEKLV